jgi:hypothetical protein
VIYSRLARPLKRSVRRHVDVTVIGEAYLRDTGPAVRGLFDLLSYYDHLTPPPSLAPFVDEQGVIILNRQQADGYMHALADSLALDTAKATLAGSILQVASKGLQEFSTNTAVSPSAHDLGVSPTSPRARFAVGREIHSIPAGLLIYAGRIQYNHYEEGRPKNDLARAVFDALLHHYYDDLTFDMAYELEWPAPRPVSHYIVRHELRWFTVDDYEDDMRTMLAVSR